MAKTNFSDGHKSVCLECLESAFEAAKGEAAFYIQELRNGLSEERWDIFSNQAAELLTFISEGAELSILRLLVTRSLQNGQTLEETLKRVCGLIPQEHVPASAMESFHPAV
ncbi:MAG TPA: hypothetical protein VFK07_02030 [Candidatus Paceibacterota bacterium]|nr:hypothetical protein [Candidatus Paceibacterota bacterium]